MKQKLKIQVYMEDVETKKKMLKKIPHQKISSFIRECTKKGLEELSK